MLAHGNRVCQLLAGKREEHEALALIVLVDHVDVRRLRDIEIEKKPVSRRHGISISEAYSLIVAKRVERGLDFVTGGSRWRIPSDSRGPESKDERDSRDRRDRLPLPPFGFRPGTAFIWFRSARPDRRRQCVPERSSRLVAFARRRRQRALDHVHE